MYILYGIYLYHAYGREKKLFRGGAYLCRPLEKSLTARVADGIKRPCAATVVVKHDRHIVTKQPSPSPVNIRYKPPPTSDVEMEITSK